MKIITWQLSLWRSMHSWLSIDLSFQDYDEEIRNFSDIYGQPSGFFLLARNEVDTIGGCGLRALGAQRGEVKRLFVRKSYQGQGVGRQLVQMLVAEAKMMGYKILLLDTLPSMFEATRLYKSLGFVETDPYRHNPIEGAQYLKLIL